jgi:hypothetical protein
MSKDVTSRIINVSKATKRAFKEIVYAYEDMRSDKTAQQIADELFELGVQMKAKMLRDERVAEISIPN